MMKAISSDPKLKFWSKLCSVYSAFALNYSLTLNPIKNKLRIIEWHHNMCLFQW